MDDREEQARQKREQDRTDLANESMGRDTGRIRRFVREDLTPESREAKRNADRIEEALRELTLQERIQHFYDRLREIDRQIAESTQRLRAMQDRANIDQSGRRFYFTRDERTAFYEDGSEVSREVRDRTPRRQSSSAWEEFRDEAAKQNALQNRRRDTVDEGLKEGLLSPEEAAILDQQQPTAATIAGHRPAISVAGEIAGGHFVNAPDLQSAYHQASAPEKTTEPATRTDRAPPQPTEGPRRP